MISLGEATAHVHRYRLFFIFFFVKASRKYAEDNYNFSLGRLLSLGEYTDTEYFPDKKT